MAAGGSILQSRKNSVQQRLAHFSNKINRDLDWLCVQSKDEEGALAASLASMKLLNEGFH